MKEVLQPMMYVGTHHQRIRPSLRLVQEVMAEQSPPSDDRNSELTAEERDRLRISLETILASVVKELLLLDYDVRGCLGAAAAAALHVAEEHVTELVAARIALNDALAKETTEAISAQDPDVNFDEVENIRHWVAQTDRYARAAGELALDALNVFQHLSRIQPRQSTTRREKIDLLTSSFAFAPVNGISQQRFTQVLRHVLAAMDDR